MKIITNKKKRVLLAMLLIVGFVLISKGTAINAETTNWSSSKTPGSSMISYVVRQMTYYTGSTSFKAQKLYSQSSSVVGVCEGYNVRINNSANKVKVNKINEVKSFTVSTSGGRLQYMKFKAYIETNADLYQLANGYGIIYNNN